MAEYRHVEYPKVLYRATRDLSGHLSYDSVTVQDSHEEQKLPSDYRESHKEALEALDALGDAISTAAAERAFTDRRMSKKAQKEMAAKEAATGAHVAE